jgi:outer membrane biosynthesis protein TonB
MTTAEFIIGHSAEDAEERKQESRKIFWALLAALVIHLLIGYGLAVFGGLLYTPFSPTDEEKPVELSFVDLAPTPAPAKNTIFVPSDESKQTEAPKDKTPFTSNVSTTAVSEQPATGSMPLPSQDGSERTSLDFNSAAASLANQGAQPQPSVAAQRSASPQPSAQPTSNTKTDEFAMLTKPTPQPSAASTPQPPKSVYQPYKERTRLAGAITNRGTSAVNAVGTPLGRYQKTLFDAIGSHWYAYIEQKADLVSLGTTRVTFFVNRNGHVKNLKVVSNDSNEAFANVCLQAILDSKLPPIPEEVAEALPPEGLESEIAFTTFSNR